MVVKMKYYLDIIKIMTIKNFKSIKIFNRDFLVGMISMILMDLISLFVSFVVVSSVKDMVGWSVNQVLFLQVYLQLILNIDKLFFDNLWNVSGREVVRGNYDYYMIKPFSSLFYSLFKTIDITCVGSIIVSIILLISLGIYNDINWLGLIISIPVSMLIVISVKIITTSFVFKMKKSRGLLFIVYQLLNFSKFPINIYSVIVRCLFTFIIPYFMGIYYPIKMCLFGKFDVLLLVGIMLFEILFFLLARYIWYYMESKYESVGN